MLAALPLSTVRAWLATLMIRVALAGPGELIEAVVQDASDAARGCVLVKVMPAAPEDTGAAAAKSSKPGKKREATGIALLKAGCALRIMNRRAVCLPRFRCQQRVRGSQRS